MNDAVKRFERLIVGFLIVLMGAVVVLSTVELAWVLAKDVTASPVLILESDELLELFGLFLLVLIGIEIFETIVKTYGQEQVDRVEVVFIVAMIAVARKVIVLDYTTTKPLTAVGIGVIIIALAGGYYLIKLSRRESIPSPESGEAPGTVTGRPHGHDTE